MTGLRASAPTGSCSEAPGAAGTCFHSVSPAPHPRLRPVGRSLPRAAHTRPLQAPSPIQAPRPLEEPPGRTFQKRAGEGRWAKAWCPLPSSYRLAHVHTVPKV